MLNNDINRCWHNTGLPDLHGQPSKLLETNVDWIDEILQTWSLEACAFIWTQLGTVAEVPEVGWRTIQRAIDKRGYNKCIACTKTYALKPLKTKHRDWTWEKRNTQTLDDWKKVRFSDEVHFGRGPQRKLQIIQKPGERTCEDCIQEQNKPEEKDKKQKRYHYWATVGWNFKSELIFDEVPGNTNGKMSQCVYIDSILELVVKPWLEVGEDFVLEEDRDSGHGSEKSNIVRDQKDGHNLKYYFNYAHSPDLSPIENCQQVPKQTVGRQPYWDDEITIVAIK